MKKSIFKKIGGLFLGLAMGLGVVTGVAAGNKASEVNAETATIDFSSPISGFGYTSGTQSNLTYTKSNVTLTASSISAKNGSCIQLVKSGTITSTKFPGVISSVYVADCKTTSSKTDGSITVQGSTNGSTFTDVKSITGLSSTANSQTITFDTTKNYTYFKIVNGSARVLLTSDIKVTYEIAVTKYNVSFNMQGHGTAPSAQTIEAGGKVAEPTAPSVSGYIFGGWYEEAACTNKWNFSTGTISGDKVLYAKWTAKTALTLTATDVNMKLGDSDKSVTVTAGGSTVSGYTLTSGNTNVISIVNNQLHVVGLGDATITITKAEDANNTYTSGTFNVHVSYADITSFELDYTEGTLGKGGEATLPGVTILPANANQDYSWGNPVATEGIVYTYDSSTHELAIDANNTVEGTIQFTATATGDSSKTAAVTYTVQAAQIAHITGVSASETGAIVAKQYVGDAFNPQGFSFAPTWSEGDHDVVEITADDISWNALVAGSNPTGIYLCADGEFTVTITGVTVVNDTLASIAFDEECDMTNKTYYTTDKSFDHTGLSISGKMDSGADAVIDTSEVEYIFSTTPAELGSGTGKSVSVYAKYGDAETDPITISGIEVKEIVLESISVTTKPSKLTYTIGESFSSTGIVVKGINNDGSDAGDLTSQCTFEYAETAFLTKGNPTITVEYGNKTATFTIEVNEKTLQPGTSKWTLVENINDLEIGDQIIITNSEHSKALGGQNSNNRGQVGVTYANNELTIGDSSPAIFELQNGKIDGTYAFYDSVNSGYLYAASSSSNYLKVESSLSNNSSFILTKNSAIAQGTNTRNSIRYNSSSSIFSCYGSGQAEINFFVQEVTPGESRTLAGITATYNHTGDTYYTGDEVVSADFTVKAWYNNGETVNNVSGFTITDSTLDKGDNTIELSYEGKKCTVLVSDIETRTATVDHVYVETETGYQVNYYLDGTTAAWNLEKINVVAYWTDGTTNTSSLSDLVESGDVTLSKAVPEVGDTSFTVSGSYYGTAVDSTHNSVTVSVVAKEITSLNWAKRFDGYSFNVFEGDTINKSAFAKQNSSSYIKANFNDETSDETYSIDNCSVALYRREGSSNIKVKDVTFDANGNYTFEAEDDGLYFLLTAGGKTTVYSDDAVFSVCERLNGIIVPGDDITKTIDTSNFSPALPTSTGSTGSSTAEGITFTYDGLYNYTKNSSSHIALPKTNGAYFASSKLSGDLKSIQVTKGDQAINSAATLYISKDGSTWTTAKVFDGSAFTYSITDEGYRYFKIVTNGSNYTNIGSLIVKYSGNTDVANTDSVTQKSVIEFAKYFYEELSEVCNSFDTTSDAFKEAWSNVSNKYDEMFGSSSTIEGLDKTLAANMFKYAYPNGRVGEEADVLQLAMQRYDTIVVRDASLSKFITRASSYNAPRLNNPIANLSNVDNSVWVISAVALIGLTAIGGYFFYRKRKENF